MLHLLWPNSLFFKLAQELDTKLYKHCNFNPFIWILRKETGWNNDPNIWGLKWSWGGTVFRRMVKSKLPCRMPWFKFPPWLQFFANPEAAMTAPVAGVSATHLCDLDWVSGSQQPGPVLAVQAFGRMTHTRGLPLLVCLSVYLSLSYICMFQWRSLKNYITELKEKLKYIKIRQIFTKAWVSTMY